MVIRGPTSFGHLKTVDGEICETFHEACLRRGLLEDDGEWELCLRDAGAKRLQSKNKLFIFN
jgi:hypothetical protein